MKKRMPRVWTWIGIGLILAGLLPALWVLFVGPIYSNDVQQELDRLTWPMVAGIAILIWGILNNRNIERQRKS